MSPLFAHIQSILKHFRLRNGVWIYVDVHGALKNHIRKHHYHTIFFRNIIFNTLCPIRTYFKTYLLHFLQHRLLYYLQMGQHNLVARNLSMLDLVKYGLRWKLTQMIPLHDWISIWNFSLICLKYILEWQQITIFSISVQQL